MSTNGNPVGSSRIAAAQKRLSREENGLTGIQVFTTDPTEAVRSIGFEIRGTVISDLEQIDILAKFPNLFSFLRDGVEVPASFVIDAIKVMRDCRKTIKRFGG